MDVRTLRYYVGVVQNGSISRASEHLHITQPALSHALKDLEQELGQSLFTRGARAITLTQAGKFLYQRAMAILSLVEQTKQELSARELAGTVSIISGESPGNACLASVLTDFHRQFPQVRLNLIAGDEVDVRNCLQQGEADFGILFFSEGRGFDNFEHLLLPYADSWGLLTSDPELIARGRITATELRERPLICSRQIFSNEELSGWLGCPVSALNIQATYVLIYNALLLAQAGFADLLCFRNLYQAKGAEPLSFVEMSPALTVRCALVWPKAAHHSETAACLLDFLRQHLRCCSTENSAYKK